eukprot:COSAG05_NODE_28673_length_119_cov_61.250000_1_plen_29_part_01
MVFYILCAYCCRCRPPPTVAIPPLHSCRS